MGNTLVLLDLLERLLGKGERKSRGNYAFTCPNCKHAKKKLEINLETRYFDCWTCGARDGFKGKKITTLLKKINRLDVLPELYTIIPEERSANKSAYSSNSVDSQIVKLPTEYFSLSNSEPQNSLQKIKRKQALKFLRTRNVFEEDVLKYEIGICYEGKYSDRIIIPSFDANANLNYFVARDFTGNLTRKYENPPISSDIIGFELYINWKLPVILCEGIFDALAIKRNVVPLFGKVIHKNLMKKLISADVEHIYISLDSDATKDAMKYAEQLISYGKKIHLVDMENGKDASEIGFEKYLEILKKTYTLNYADIIALKLK